MIQWQTVFIEEKRRTALREAQIAQEEEKERWSRLGKIEKISELQKILCQVRIK